MGFNSAFKGLKYHSLVQMFNVEIVDLIFGYLKI